jgi:exodeoxyribonuclease-3
MRLASWNVNSIRARDARLRAWLASRAPDVVCLQELKCEVAQLPEWLAADGWQIAATGQKTYNGVAILSRRPLENVLLNLGDGGDGEAPEQARLACATVDGVKVISAYFPNGNVLGSDKYQYKLRWMQRLRAWLEKHCKPEEQVALCGDFNVAPEARDVHDPPKWENTVLYAPEIRAALEKQVRSWGFVDAFRQHEQGQVFSWWDYRAGAFRKDQGLRIDHVFVTESLAKRTRAARVDREERVGETPSDHAPVIVEIE